MSKILFVYASYGNGHRLAAESIKDFFSAECVDILDYIPPWLKRFSVWTYHFVSGPASFIWRMMFISSNTVIGAQFVKSIEYLLFWRFRRYLKEINPDIIITTHFTPPSVIASMKREMGFKLIMYVTDMIAHRLWYSKSVDLYFALTDKAKDDLLRFGVQPDKIYVGYASVRSGFLVSYDKPVLKAKWSLDDKPCLLFMASNLGRFPFLRRVLSDYSDKFNFFIIYGRNLKLKAYLEQTSKSNVIALPFYSDIWELMYICDIMITKPGGMTVTEGCFLKKKFIFTTFIPGQEEGNINILENAGVGKRVRTYDELKKYLDDLMTDICTCNYPIHFEDIRLKLRGIIDDMSVCRTANK